MSIAALALLLAASGAPTQQSIVYRCLGVHGETVYSGQPCRSLEGLTAAPREEPPPAWQAAAHCAASATELRQRLRAALEKKDVNTLAALFLWRGYGTRRAYADLNHLQALFAKPLADVTLQPAAPPVQAAPAASSAGNATAAEPPPPQALRIRLSEPGLGTRTQSHDFPVVQADGCFWLSMPGAVPGAG